ncbi:MAG: PepSY domain-containing protein [Oscillospiraceae bacterium]|nr:PepSY domain-containing protein [Oscillospiraceae bacterium]
MVQEEALLRCARTLFPAAVLCLGSLSEGRSTVTEAIAAALRKSPDAWESDAVRQLIRICRTRAPERIVQHSLPQDAALEPLLPILKLPAGSRRALALAVSGISDADAAAASGVSAEEHSQKTEKALRQLTFMQNGTPPELADLQAAARHLPWHETDTEMLLAGIEESEQTQEPEPEPPQIRAITRSEPKKASGKTVAVPLWGIVLGAVSLIVLAASLMLLWASQPHRSAVPPPDAPRTEEVSSLFSGQYLSIGKAQAIAAEDAGAKADAACFLSTKLKADESPASYLLSFTLSSGQQYAYTLDAVSGEILSKSQTDADVMLNTEGWLSAEELRQAAMRRTGLHDVLFLKEKCEAEGDTGCCKYELLDAAGRLYSVQIDARTAMLMKYTAEELSAREPENIITPEQAKMRALSRVGDLDPSQVIFTKVKQDGSAYLISFTLDDGTQYLIELNAENGNVNTVDVHPVSADITQAVGLLAARDTALRMAELTDRDPVEFTKAKIDRSSGSYVYELEFETPDYEYEVSIRTETGEVLKYRVWQQ